MHIEDHIPYGYRNKIDRISLEIRTGYSDRQNRQMIEEAMLERNVKIANVGGGYFRPDGSPEDELKWKEYCFKELKRTSTQNRKSNFLRATLPPHLSDMEKNQVSMFDLLGGDTA